MISLHHSMTGCVKLKELQMYGSWAMITSVFSICTRMPVVTSPAKELKINNYDEKQERRNNISHSYRVLQKGIVCLTRHGSANNRVCIQKRHKPPKRLAITTHLLSICHKQKKIIAYTQKPVHTQTRSQINMRSWIQLTKQTCKHTDARSSEPRNIIRGFAWLLCNMHGDWWGRCICAYFCVHRACKFIQLGPYIWRHWSADLQL